MPPAADVAAALASVVVLPRRLSLSTPGVQATVPMIRGVWGAALHDLDPAAYQAVFAPGDAGPPPGYLLRPGPADPRIAPAIDWFLFGAALPFDESLRRAWDVASGMGLGPQRRRFVVRAFVPLGPDDRPAASPTPWPISEAGWPLAGPPEQTPCRLSFPAPLRLLRDRRLIDRPTLADIVVAAWRRVRSLMPQAALAAWDGAQAELLDAARGRPASAWHGGRLDLQRWSARQQAEVELHGVSGWLDLPEGPGDLWPLLAAVCWLHVGKGTTTGLGEMRVGQLTL